MATIQERVQLIVEVFAKNLNQFSAMLGESGETLQRWHDRGLEASTMGGRLAFRIRQMTTGFKGFRMELLSVLFFGMSISRFFRGLLQPALQLVGAFDIFTAMLQILFLPTALFLLDNVFLPLFNFFTNLPPWVQKLIGGIVVLGIVLGSAMSFIGQFLLGIGGLIIFLGGLNAFKVGWGSILQKGIFGSSLAGMRTSFSKFMGFLRGVATAGILIKTAMDIESFAKGKTDFNEFLGSMATNLALAGLVWLGKGGGWLLALAVAVKIVQKGTEIRRFGEDILEKAVQAFEGDERVRGAILTAIGKPIQEIGGIGEATANWLRGDGFTSPLWTGLDLVSDKTQEFGGKVIDTTNKLNQMGQQFNTYLGPTMEEISLKAGEYKQLLIDSGVNADIATTMSNNYAESLKNTLPILQDYTKELNNMNTASSSANKNIADIIGRFSRVKGGMDFGGIKRGELVGYLPGIQEQVKASFNVNLNVQSNYPVQVTATGGVG